MRYLPDCFGAETPHRKTTMQKKQKPSKTHVGFDACRHAVYALCESITDDRANEDSDFDRGMRTAARRIAKELGSMDADLSIARWRAIKRLIPPKLYEHEGTLVLVDLPPAPNFTFDSEK